MACRHDPCTCPEMYYRNDQTWKKGVLELLCNIWNGIIDPSGAYGNAVFEPLVAVLYSALGAGYILVEDLPDGTRSFTIVNHTDGDVIVSMDGGVTDTYLLAAAESISMNLMDVNLVTTAQISLKQGSYPPNEGSVLIYSIH